jgi:Rieske Fe-S protein
MGSHVSDENANPARAAQLGPLNRRAVLAAGGVAGASAALLAVAGCATYSNGQSTPQTNAGQPSAPDAAAPGAGDDASGQAAAPDAAASGAAVGAASAIPVGGGKIFADQSVVVTQPTAGTFKAFSAICTHQGCTVNAVSAGTINCPCHGSKFNIADGSVTAGPAKKPLPAKQVTDDGGQLRVS